MVSLCHYSMISANTYAVIMALWRGELVQQNNEQHDIDCKTCQYVHNPYSNSG